MLKRVLVAVDRSRCAQAALQAALSIAKANAAEVCICHVIDMTKIGAAVVEVGGSTLDALEAAGKALLEAARARAANFGITADTALIHGVTVPSIVECAKDHGADAIVIGSHAKSGLRQLFVGSVAEAVLRKSDVPVFVIRGGLDDREIDSTLPFQRILVAYDGSAFADRALLAAKELAASPGSELSICYVVDLTNTINIIGIGHVAVDAVLEGFKEVGDAALERARALSSCNVARTHLRAGFPVDEIVACAKEIGADLIILGTHGRGGFSRLFLGSIAQNVMQQSIIPVMIVGGNVRETATTGAHYAEHT